jgi:hypothetical protein
MNHDGKIKQISRQSLKRLALLPLVMVGVLAIVFGLFFYLNSTKTYEGKPVSLTIGTPGLETNALIYIAADMSYFDRNALNVTIKEYDSGGAAVPGLVRNEVDLAIASEFAMVYNLLQQVRSGRLGALTGSRTCSSLPGRTRGLEDEARWMIKNNLTREKQIPDFMNYIYVDGLKAVKPEAVSIIR